MKISLTESMAGWEHKERNWSKLNQDDISGERIKVHEMVFSHEDDPGHAKSNSKYKSFTEWLDWQCEEGWEVFKISRDFSRNAGTWCIFRRLV